MANTKHTPARPIEWEAEQQAYRATEDAIRNAELSGRGTLRANAGPGWHDYDDFSMLCRRDEHSAAAKAGSAS